MQPEWLPSGRYRALAWNATAQRKEVVKNPAPSSRGTWPDYVSADAAAKAREAEIEGVYLDAGVLARRRAESRQVFDPIPMHLEHELCAGGQQSDTLVYFVQSDDGRIKVGCARRPSQRLKTLQTGSSQGLRLVGLMRGGRDLERHLHVLFAKSRVAGEWFHPHPFILEAIRQVRWEFGVAA